MPNEPFLKAFADAWNNHDIEALMNHMAEDSLFISSSGTRTEGAEAVRDAFTSVFEAFPDARWRNDVHFVSANRGVSEWVFSGTDADDGTVVEEKGCDIFTFQDGEMIRGYRYFHGSDFCYIQEDYDRFTFEPHNMAMTLRPGEMLKRNWIGRDIFFDYKRKKASFEGGNSYAIPIRYADGQLIWRPDLTSKLAPTFINKNQAPVFMTHDGQHPPLHVRNKQGGLYDFEERVIIQTETPYTILGGKVKARLYRGAATDWDRLSLTIGSTTGPIKKRIWEAPEGVIGSIDAEVNLDEVLYPTGERGRHDHTLEFNFAANEKNDPPTQSGIESIEIVTDIQVAPNSLPALSRGKNVIRFRPQWKVMYKKG
jgi:ketosteroid isomerase-like protein